MSTRPQPTVLVAPDGCTRYLASAVAHELERLPRGEVLEVRALDPIDRADLAEWCLTAGKRIHNPFDHWCIGTLQVSDPA